MAGKGKRMERDDKRLILKLNEGMNGRMNRWGISE